MLAARIQLGELMESKAAWQIWRNLEFGSRSQWKFRCVQCFSFFFCPLSFLALFLFFSFCLLCLPNTHHSPAFLFIICLSCLFIFLFYDFCRLSNLPLSPPACSSELTTSCRAWVPRRMLMAVEGDLRQWQIENVRRKHKIQSKQNTNAKSGWHLLVVNFCCNAFNFEAWWRYLIIVIDGWFSCLFVFAYRMLSTYFNVSHPSGIHRAFLVGFWCVASLPLLCDFCQLPNNR